MEEGYVGKAKGMRQVLREHGWYVDGMSTITKDAENKIGKVLVNLPDFVCMYVCMVITYSRVWINRVRLPILLVVS